jgi:plasmid stability protein
MCGTCNYDPLMSTMIQIRHVPDPVHRKLKARAAKRGMSLSGYLREEMERLANQMTMEEFYERLKTRTPVIPSIPPEDIIRADRDSR